jgi:hypothetical protein
MCVVPFAAFGVATAKNARPSCTATLGVFRDRSS